MDEALIVIGPTPPPRNGVALMTVELLEALAASRRRPIHLDTRDPRPLASMGRLDLRNVQLGLRHVAQLGALLARHRRAGVYVPISQSTWGFARDAIFLLMARAARRPRYVHLHGGYFDTFYRTAPFPLRALIRAALAGVKQAWVLTPTLARCFEGLVPAGRVHVVENAVADVRTPRPERGPRVRLLYLSNLVPEKGCFDFVAALERLGARGADLEVRIVGGDVDPSVRPALARRAAALAERGGAAIEVLAAVDATGKDRELGWADVFVYPTCYPFEGQPLVLLEALAAGLPVVTTAHAGIPDTIEHGRHGLVVEPGDVAALADALAEIAADTHLRVRAGAAARALYEERYTPERFRRTVAALVLAR